MSAFIDDLKGLNNGDEFERNYREVFLQESELKKEININTKGSFLDFRSGY